MYIYSIKTLVLHYVVFPRYMSDNRNKYTPILTEMFQLLQKVFNPIMTFKHCLLNVMSAKYNAVFHDSCAVIAVAHKRHKTKFAVICSLLTMLIARKSHFYFSQNSMWERIHHNYKYLLHISKYPYLQIFIHVCRLTYKVLVQPLVTLP